MFINTHKKWFVLIWREKRTEDYLANKYFSAPSPIPG